jgi:hypothetical protein
MPLFLAVSLFDIPEVRVRLVEYLHVFFAPLTNSGLKLCIVQCTVSGQRRSLEQLADGPTGCGEVVTRWCLHAWNFTVTSAVHMEAEGRTRPNMTLSLH